MRFPLTVELLAGFVACLSFPFATNAQDASPRVVKYHVTMDTVKYVYGTMPAVARLASGEILDADTVDAFDDIARLKAGLLSRRAGLHAADDRRGEGLADRAE